MKTILIVEDNPADSRLLDEAFREAHVPTSRSIVRDGEEALAFLKREGRYRDAPRPDLILLDLNLPKKDGRAVIREIRADNALRRIPVVVLSGSADKSEMARLESEGVDHSLVKPSDLDTCFDRVNALLEILED
jgi:chemotaxis family two-component system response regulator Rcp1